MAPRLLADLRRALPGHIEDIRNLLTAKVGWVVGPFAVQQSIRLITNIALARLLAPEMFAIMLLINTLRTGVELLSDIGIGQSVVRSPQGDEKHFLNTAWTLQVMRGALLAAVAVAAAFPLTSIYGDADLLWILLAVTPVFILTGFQSPQLFVVQRHMRLRVQASYDLACAIFQAVVTIALAAIMQSIWALVWGLVISTAFSTFMSYAIGRWQLPSFTWDRRALFEILHFGKWIFFSTAIYFAAMSTDKFYFIAALPLAVAGVYAIARTFSDLFDALAHRAGALLIFPRLAALGDKRGEAAAGLRHKRRLVLVGAALGIALALAVSDQLMLLLYDDRYRLAAFMLPILFAAVWFRVLGSLSDAMLMGCSRPAPGAFANTAKFLTLVVGLPLAIAYSSVFGALLVLVLAEVMRWAVLAPVLQREKLASVFEDVGLTLLAAIGAVATKMFLGWIGLVPTIGQWWAMGLELHG